LCVGRRSRGLPIANLLQEKVQLDIHGAGQLIIELNAPVRELRLVLPGEIVDGHPKEGNRWLVALRGLRTGTFAGKLECERGSLGEIRFEAIRGISEEDLGL